MLSWDGFSGGGLTVDGSFNTLQGSILFPRNGPRLPQAFPLPPPKKTETSWLVPPYPDAGDYYTGYLTAEEWEKKCAGSLP